MATAALPLPQDRQVMCACGGKMALRDLGMSTVLRQCGACSHIGEILKDQARFTRSMAFGGVQSFDTIRLALTWRRISRLLRRIGSKQLDVLELGCGPGQLIAKFRAAGHRPIGIDAGMLKIAPLPQVADVIEYGRSVENLSAESDRFDLIVAIHLIEHLMDPQMVLEKCRNALRPEGLLYLITPNAASQLLDWAGPRWWFLEDPTHVQFFSCASARAMLTSAGFDQVEARQLLSDSLSVETASFMRSFIRPHAQRGVMARPVVRMGAVAALPLTVLMRLLMPRLRASIEVVGRAPAVC